MKAQVENLIDSINDSLSDIEFELEKIGKCITGGESINDVDKFISGLKLENLYSTELEKFINEYLKYYND